MNVHDCYMQKLLRSDQIRVDKQAQAIASMPVELPRSGDNYVVNFHVNCQQSDFTVLTICNHRIVFSNFEGYDSSSNNNSCDYSSWYDMTLLVVSNLAVVAYTLRWRGAATGRPRALDLRSNSTQGKSCVTTLGKLFTPMCVPLSPSSITWYRSRGGDALRLGR